MSKFTPIELPEFALEALSIFDKAGYDAWIVGGFVRDALLGRPSHDIDIAAGCLWSRTKKLFIDQGWKTHETGTKHGTITVIKDNNAIEITTFRNDGIYLPDARHPKQVTFLSNIEDDLGRRDFTINALAYRPDKGILDLYGGLADLDSGIIRCVGDPDKRFREDALRILRACRFASQLGFTIERTTENAMVRHKGLLVKVAIERVSEELDKLLLGGFAGQTILSYVDVLSVVLPELVAMKDFDQHTPYHIYNVLEHTCRAVDAIAPTRQLRWAALCHDMGKPASFFLDSKNQGHFYGHPTVSSIIAEGILTRLSFSKAKRDKILTLIKLHDETPPASQAAVRKLLNKLNGDVELLRDLLALKRADTQAQAPEFDRTASIDAVESTLNEILASKQAFTLSHLAISGKDVLEVGIPEGCYVGNALNFLLEGVIDGSIHNDRDSLMDSLLRWWEESSDKDI